MSHTVFSHHTKLAYLAPPHSYHYYACEALCDSHPYISFPSCLVPCNSFDEIFAQAIQSSCIKGVIAVHNSIAGDVFNHAERIKDLHLHVFDTITIPIEHTLIAPHGVSFEDITDVFVHPQVAMQTVQFLKSVPHWKQHIISSTSEGARQIKHMNIYHETQYTNHKPAQLPTEPSSKPVVYATIGSVQLAQAYDLAVLKPHLADHVNNNTTFYVFGTHS